MKLNNFWMVWNESHGMPTYKHNSLETAKREAERLAGLNPGDTFKILQFIAECKKNFGCLAFCFTRYRILRCSILTQG